MLSAIPRIGKGFQHLKLTGDVSTPINLPSGCVFHGRCPYAQERCMKEVPVAQTLEALESGTVVACHGVEEGRL